MKAIAYAHGPERIHKLARAFADGCKRHGIECPIATVTPNIKPANVDLVWLYGMGPAMPVFTAYEGKAKRLIADKGYFAEYADHKNKYFRFSVDSQQPTQVMVRDVPLERWVKFGVKVEPVKAPGDYVLICGMGPKQCDRLGFRYGQWERLTVPWLKTMYPDAAIYAREKPKNAPIPGIARCGAKSATKAIRGARVVVCRTGNIGADAILHGVEVVAFGGPGELKFRDRDHALANIAHWQWTPAEMASGEYMDYLKAHIL